MEIIEPTNYKLVICYFHFITHTILNNIMYI